MRDVGHAAQFFFIPSNYAGYCIRRKRYCKEKNKKEIPAGRLKALSEETRRGISTFENQDTFFFGTFFASFSLASATM